MSISIHPNTVTLPEYSVLQDYFDELERFANTKEKAVIQNMRQQVITNPDILDREILRHRESL